MVEKNLGFRGWFYFRTGWATYFAFIVAAVNALTVTFFLAIEEYPSLSVIFLDFWLILDHINNSFSNPGLMSPS